MENGTVETRVILDGLASDQILGVGCLDTLPERLRGRPTVIVVDGGAAAGHTERVSGLCARLDLQARVDLPGGEVVKTATGLEALWRALADAALPRDGVLVGLGGGAVLDLAGLAAATWQRGVEFVSAPSTLLAAVDASVGGKTGINLGTLKNPVGAFHPARRVYLDPSLLDTLPRRHWRNGLAETVKTAILGDVHLFDDLERHAAELARQLAFGDPDQPPQNPALLPVADWIRRAVAVKTAVVSVDLREAGPRRALNLGHTLGHALELSRGLDHGEAVALGTAAVARYAAAEGLCDPGDAGRIVAVLAACGLPVSAEPPVLEAVEPLLRRDKKQGVDGLRWVLPHRIGYVDADARVDLPRLLAALAG
jgi:3-dehydroquinate synthetase